MNFHQHRPRPRPPSAALLSSATTAIPSNIPSPARQRATTVDAQSSSAIRNIENSRIQSPRSYRSLRDHAGLGTQGQMSPSITSPSSNTTSASAAARSRSGSSTRFLSVNTQAASSSTPNMHSATQAQHLTGPGAGGSNVLRTPDSVDGSQQQHQNNTSANSSSPASAVPPSAVSTPSPMANGYEKRDRGLTHKNSSRTIGGTSVLSVGAAATANTSNQSTNANANVPRKASSASAQRPSGSRDIEKPRGAREKPSNRALGRSRLENTTEEDEDVIQARTLRLLLHDTEAAPPTLMYWSRAPVWGSLPTHRMRSHSASVVDSTTIWMFGGCDDKEFWRDVLCLDVETLECTRPETNGDVPPPCRAHTATLVDRRLFVFGGGQGNLYYNSLYVLDTLSRRWTHVPFNTPVESTHHANAHAHTHTMSDSPSSTSAPESIDQTLSSSTNKNNSNPSLNSSSAHDDTLPRPRRAHTTVLYKSRLVVFGGGNGAMALNDVWVLDVSVPYERMRWVKQRTTGSRPSPRGYHTANLVGNVMVVVGGSDGRQTFADIYCLNLDTWHWSMVHTDRLYRRLAHTATQIGSYLFIMGGHDGSQYTNELLLFNLVSLQYEPRTIRGIPPSPRGYHAAALADGRLWVFGGYDGRAAHDDMYMLDLASSAYLSQVTGFQINVD